MATLGNEFYMMEEDTIEKIGMKIVVLEKVIHFTENPEEKKHLREKESQLREKERQLREKENLQLQLQLKSLSHPKRQKMDYSLDISKIVSNKNFDKLLSTHTILPRANIGIYGPKGVGKSTALLWLYHQLEHNRESVKFIDLICETTEDLSKMDFSDDILLLDNAHKATINHSPIFSRAKKVIAAFSPLGFYTHEYNEKYAIGDNALKLYFVPLTSEQAMKMIEPYKSKYKIYEHEIDEIISASQNIPRYITTCLHHIMTYSSAAPAATNNPNDPSTSAAGNPEPSTSAADNLAYTPRVLIGYEAIHRYLKEIYDKAKSKNGDLSRAIISGQLIKSSLQYLLKYGIVYNENASYYFTHPDILGFAYLDCGLEAEDTHWHTLEKRTALILQICSHKVTTLPQSSPCKELIIPQALVKFYGNGVNDLNVHNNVEKSVYLVECGESQGTYNLIVVDKPGFRVIFVQVSKMKYSGHSKPGKNFGHLLIEKLREIHQTQFLSYYVYATIRLQNYTRPGSETVADIYFLDLNKAFHAKCAD